MTFVPANLGFVGKDCLRPDGRYQPVKFLAQSGLVGSAEPLDKHTIVAGDQHRLWLVRDVVQLPDRVIEPPVEAMEQLVGALFGPRVVGDLPATAMNLT